MRNHLLVLLTICVTGLGFNSLTGPGPGDPVPIPPNLQRRGNADSGYQYIITGDYVNSGLPIGFYRVGIGTDKRNFLRREGVNATMRHDFNMVKAPNGVAFWL